MQLTATIKRLLSKWLATPMVRVVILQRDPLRVNMMEWRADKALCQKAEAALSNPVVRQMLDVLRATHIGQWAFPHDAGMEKRSLFAAKCEGYSECLNNFEALAIHQKPVESLEMTYGVPEIEEEQT